MSDLYKDLLGEFQDVDAKLLRKFLGSFEQPKIAVDKIFKKHLAKKIAKAIAEKTSAAQEQVIATVPNFVKWRYRLVGFVTAMCAFLFVFILSFFSDFFSNQIYIPARYQRLPDQAFLVSQQVEDEGVYYEEAGVYEETMVVATDSVFGRLSNFDLAPASLGAVDVGAGFQEETAYKFLYDGKKYPKVASSLPVYKRGGALVNEELISRSLSSLKVGDLSLKRFPEMTFRQTQLVSKADAGYQISLDMEGGRFTLLDYAATEVIDTEIPTEKEIRKRIERKLKSLGISLHTYGPLELTSSEDGETKAVYTLFYPFLMHGYRVYDYYLDLWGGKPLGIYGTYNVFTDQLSLRNVDVAQYEVSNYPGISNDEVMGKLITGGDFFKGGSSGEHALGIKTSAPEMVYLLQDAYYLPALRFRVDPSHYPVAESTSVLYVLLVNF